MTGNPCPLNSVTTSAPAAEDEACGEAAGDDIGEMGWDGDCRIFESAIRITLCSNDRMQGTHSQAPH